MYNQRFKSTRQTLQMLSSKVLLFPNKQGIHYLESIALTLIKKERNQKAYKIHDQTAFKPKEETLLPEKIVIYYKIIK